MDDMGERYGMKETYQILSESLNEKGQFFWTRRLQGSSRVDTEYLK